MKSRHKIRLVHRAICFLLAVYLFNFSIDSRDAHPDTVAEDLSINDIESFFEFMAEHVMGIDNAVAEHEERDQDDSGSFEFKKYYFLVRVSLIEAKAAIVIQTLDLPFTYNDQPLTQFIEINSPPPRA